MLAAMGYAGGGRVPLMSVKRQERVGLQDDEALAVDRTVEVAKKRRRITVTLKKCMIPGNAKNPSWHASSSSSEEAVPEDSETPKQQVPGTRGRRATTLASKSMSRCHGCGRAFSQWASLREHVLERLLANTTRDPTNLHANFDAEHHDRDAVRCAAAAAASGGARESRGETNCPLAATMNAPAMASTWHCPIKGCQNGTFSEFLVMLEHAAEAPVRRVEHRRLLALVAELLLREPPPRLPLKPDMEQCTALWCSEGLSRLFAHCLSQPGTTGGDYPKLEEEVLGPSEEDMFELAVAVQRTADAAVDVREHGTEKTTFL